MWVPEKECLKAAMTEWVQWKEPKKAGAWEPKKEKMMAALTRKVQQKEQLKEHWKGTQKDERTK